MEPEHKGRIKGSFLKTLMPVSYFMASLTFAMNKKRIS